MRHLAHHSILVIGSVGKHVQQARDSAVRYGLGPSEITGPLPDDTKVFFMIPANDNERGSTALYLTAELRHRFIDWLEQQETSCEWCEVEEPKLVAYKVPQA